MRASGFKLDLNHNGEVEPEEGEAPVPLFWGQGFG